MIPRHGGVWRGWWFWMVIEQPPPDRGYEAATGMGEPAGALAELRDKARELADDGRLGWLQPPSREDPLKTARAHASACDEPPGECWACRHWPDAADIGAAGTPVLVIVTDGHDRPSGIAGLAAAARLS